LEGEKGSLVYMGDGKGSMENATRGEWQRRFLGDGKGPLDNAHYHNCGSCYDIQQ